MEVERGVEVGEDREPAVGDVDRRLAGEDRGDVGEHGRGGLDAAGPGAGDRDLADRRALEGDRVERALDRGERVAAVEEAGEDPNADRLAVQLGDAEQLQREAELLGVGDVVGADLGDPLERDVLERRPRVSKARRARIAIFAAASAPLTSSVGSASA